MSYADYLSQSVPGFLQDPNGQALMKGLGRAIDGQAARLVQAVTSSFPNYRVSGVLQTPTDALAAIGDDRQLDRAPGESDSAYAARLQTAWDAWLWAGTTYGLLNALKIAGLDGGILVQQNGQLSQLVSGAIVTTPFSNWTFDYANAWSNFAIIYPLGSPTLTDAQASELLKLVREWKPAYARFMGAYVITSGGSWGYSAGTWGDGTTWGGTVIQYGP